MNLLNRFQIIKQAVIDFRKTSKRDEPKSLENSILEPLILKDVEINGDCKLCYIICLATPELGYTRDNPFISSSASEEEFNKWVDLIENKILATPNISEKEMDELLHAMESRAQLN